MAKKRAARPDLSRLKVLASGDEAAFRQHVVELLATGDRLVREATLEALVDRPLADLRPQLRALYFEVDADGAKHDPGAHIRANIARVLLASADVRDVDIAIRATDTYESTMGTGGTSGLRALGLKLVAATSPDLFPYIAAEHVSDASEFSSEPANTALQLLAGTGHTLSVYQWLCSWRPADSAIVAAAVELLADAPVTILSRAVRNIMAGALARKDEWLLTTIAETIVNREMDDAYPAIGVMMQAGISAELFGYLALLLAGTNRPPLLAILDEQMEDVRRRPAIVAALKVRTTPEQEALLKKWEDELR